MNGNNTPGGAPGIKPKGRPGQGQSPDFSPMRGLIIWMIVFAGIVAIFHFWNTRRQDVEEKPFSPDFVQLVNDGKIKECRIVTDMSGRMHVSADVVPPDNSTGARPLKIKVNITDGDKVQGLLQEKKVGYRNMRSSPLLWEILSGALPVLLLFGVLYFVFIRQIRSAGHGIMGFGRSRAKLLMRGSNKITFENVAGIDEAKEEVQEIIEFLKDPKKFQTLGGRIPKGVLLMGPPGTGKTLLAKAIAGQADVPFFSISGSDFVEMFVGVGASRVRDMFEQGKKNAPCLVFIDEIDAVGRSRFTGIGGGHDEREQTLNALLVEMDGFETSEGVIIIAATNRPDVLDPALLRPGRFDRQIVIDLPTLDGREAILKMHARKLKLSPGAELRRIARGTPGFSGADLENLLNEAALLAARSGKAAIEIPDLEEARDKVRWGRERRSRVLDEKDKKITAYHEAGHAIVTLNVKQSEPIHKITIIPRGTAYLGATMQLPEKDRYLEGREKLESMLATYMGGRIAEEMTFGDVTTGARSDLREATRIARHMVCDWGMSQDLGPRTFGEKEELMFLGREVSRHQDYSEETSRKIDEEINLILKRAFEKARSILFDNKDKLELIAGLLLEKETLDGIEVEELLKHGRILDEAERGRQESAGNDDKAAAVSEKPAGAQG